MLPSEARERDGIGRVVVVDHRAPDVGWIAYAGVWSVGGLALAIRFFKHLEPVFAENV